MEKTQDTAKKPNKIKEMLKNNFFDKAFESYYGKIKELGLMETYSSFHHWTFGWQNLRTLFKMLWDYEVVGRQNFPEYGPAIAISNHQSELDPFLVGSAANRWIRWVSKKENFEIPIFKSIITPFRTIGLKRGESDAEAIAEIKAGLENGDVIGIFPEGTRSPDGKLGKFHKGAAKFCIECQVPYVPHYLDGAYKILPKNKPWYKMRMGENKVQVRVGRPVFIDPDVEVNLESLTYITQEMENDIKLLKEGKFNESRTIYKQDIINGKSIVQKSETIERVAYQKKAAEMIKIPNFNPATDFSIS